MSACRIAHGLLPLLVAAGFASLNPVAGAIFRASRVLRSGCGRDILRRRREPNNARSRASLAGRMRHILAQERAPNAVRSLSPFGERVGVRGLPVVVIDPNPLTHSLMLRKTSSPLPPELGLARVRHVKSAEVG